MIFSGWQDQVLPGSEGEGGETLRDRRPIRNRSHLVSIGLRAQAVVQLDSQGHG